MSKYFFATFIPTLFLFLFSLVLAEPTINSIVVEPSKDLWLNENPTIYVNVTDSDSSIEGCYARITYPIEGGSMSFERGNSLWSLTIPSEFYLRNIGNYNVTVYCKNSNNQTANESISLTVSQLTNQINVKTPKVYVGDKYVEINAVVKKNRDAPLSDGVEFVLLLDGNEYPIKAMIYDSIAGWTLFTDVPTTPKLYKLTLIAKYDRVNASADAYLEVKDPLEFRLESLDKTEVLPNDVIQATIIANERETPINLTNQNLVVKIGGKLIDASLINITKINNKFYVKIPVNLTPGVYTLEILLNYKNYEVEPLRSTIGCLMQINGNVNTKIGIKFISNGVVKNEIQSTNGAYSGFIVPGTYTVVFDLGSLPQYSTLYFYNVEVWQFNDPIKYYYLTLDVPGIKNAGLFVYQVAPPLADTLVNITMSYDKTKVEDQKSLVVYKCTEWNDGTNTCVGEWKIQENAVIDPLHKTATLTDTLSWIPSAYIIGTKKKLSLIFSWNETAVYGLKSSIKIKGMVQDDSGPVDGAIVNVSLDGKILASSKSDNGVFVLEFVAPEKEGEYKLLVTAEKKPYESFNKTVLLKVERSKEVSLAIPDPVKVRQGENKTVSILIINTGQSNITNLSISLDGLPSEYYSIAPTSKNLAVGEKMVVPINFKIPENASEGTFKASIKISSNEISKEEIFGFTIEKSMPASTSSINLPTAKVVLPSFVETAYIFSFGFLSIFSAYSIKKMKKAKSKRREMINLLLDIRREIRKNKMVSLKEEAIENKKIQNNELMQIKNIISKKNATKPFEESEKTIEEKVKEGLRYLF